MRGSTTSSFDSVKQFYLDVYEALGNLMIIPVALNNIKYRSDISAMNPIEKNVNSLEDYIKLTKASRYHYCLDSEVYTGFLKILVNAKLRNAIGHNDVEYNSVDQLITIYSLILKTEQKRKTEYLLQFENEAMHMFQGNIRNFQNIYTVCENLPSCMMGKYLSWFKNEQDGLRKLDAMNCVHVVAERNTNFATVSPK